MSGMNGSEFVHMLRAHRTPHLRNVPVVGLVSDLGTNRELLAAGADCTLRKPVHDGDLVRAVRWVLEVYGERQAKKMG